MTTLVDLLNARTGITLEITDLHEAVSAESLRLPNQRILVPTEDEKRLWLSNISEVTNPKLNSVIQREKKHVKRQANSSQVSLLSEASGWGIWLCRVKADCVDFQCFELKDVTNHATIKAVPVPGQHLIFQSTRDEDKSDLRLECSFRQRSDATTLYVDVVLFENGHPSGVLCFS